MKTSYLLFIVLLSLHLAGHAQEAYTGAIGDENWTRYWTSFTPNGNNYMSHHVTLPHVIDKDMTLTNKNVYLLSGTVYVTNNAVLSIEAGTVIRGESETCGTLVITKGCKLIANGTERDPIIFTSNKSAGERKAGDWGGIIILGNAPTNFIGGVNAIDWGLDTKYTQYGGDRDDDNSGSLHYVRIEYPGNKIKVDEEFNGLTLAGVGKNTVIDHIQVSYSNDDSFELYGGSVELKKIISYKCSDDDFDFNYGYQGSVSQGIAFRNSLIGDFSGSHCFEADSYNADKKGFDPNRRFTKLNASHFTLIQFDINGNNETVFSTEAIQIGNDCQFSLENSVVSGFPVVFQIKNNSFKEQLLKGTLSLSSNSFAGYASLFHGQWATELKSFTETSALKNTFTDKKSPELFVDILQKVYPDFKYTYSKPTLVSK